jgi:ankyrin repeat protein
MNHLLHKKFSEEEFNSLLTLLISKGANLNIQDDATGATALILTALAGHTDTMKLLLNYGADPLIKDKEGMTALDLMKSDKTANAPEREEKIQLLETAMKSAVVPSSPRL